MSNWYLNLPDKMTPKQVSAIMRQSLAGNLYQSYQLIQRMRDSWPEFQKCEWELRSAVADTEFKVIPYASPGEEPTKSAQEKADLIRRALESFQPNRFEEEEGIHGLIFDLTDAVMSGISVVELLWNENGVDPEGNREKQIRATGWIHPRHYSFTAGGSVGISPNDTDLTIQFPSQVKNQPLLDNPSKFLVAKFKGKAGTVLGSGFARVLMPIWVAVVYGWDFMLTYSQKYGNPFLDIAYQAGISQDEIDKFEDLAKKAQNQTYCVHPNNGEIKVLPPPSMAGDNAHVALRRMADEFCQKVILGQTLTSSPPNTTGSYALGTVHQDIRAERIESIAHWVGRILTEQLATSLLLENYGDASERPNVIPDMTRPLSVQEQAQMISAISMSTLPLPKKEMYQKLMISVPNPGDEVLIMGRPTILDESLTEDEYKQKEFELQLQQQVEMAKVMGPPEPAPAKGKGKPGKKSKTKASVPVILANASKTELEELESLVTAAERAPHPNGELTALKAALDKIGGRR